MTFNFVENFAHSGQKTDGSDWQPLNAHLRAVAALAERFARESFGDASPLGDLARAAGLLHDLGKYRVGFQRHIRDLAVARPETYHKQFGAVEAALSRNAQVSFVVQGHHGGLPDSADWENVWRNGEYQRELATIRPIAERDCPELAALKLLPSQAGDLRKQEFETRLLFSCLVDADWSDTAAHERACLGLPPFATAQPPEFSTWLENLRQFVANCAQNCPEQSMRDIRAEILCASLNAAETSPGFFSLTVPTGGGKTLSSVAFALRHIEFHNAGAPKLPFRRIIYVAPYLTILEQNARVLRTALGIDAADGSLIEHHSLAKERDFTANSVEETAATQSVRRAENWDAPFVITTSVQFFESLFSNLPGRCRKLHNIAGSVVILDECQTLPPDFVAPTCAMLRDVVERLQCTIVLCTATQPAFDHPKMAERLEPVRPIIPATLNLFERLKRVNVQWPGKGDPHLTWQDVAGRMREFSAALTVVNTRKAAAAVFAALATRDPTGVYHLSTSMCPAHRLQVIDQVRQRLEAGDVCYLVSTQLIEAGVDLDFPFVMREFAPLEAVIQAAGRCNREGRIKPEAGVAGGLVQVFRSVDGKLPPDGWYKAGIAELETTFLNQNREPRIDDPDVIREYFERLYWQRGRDGLDKHRIVAMRPQLKFATIAERYRLIPDDGIPVVIATWEGHSVEKWLDAVRAVPSRSNFRQLIPFQVNFRRYELAAMGGAITEEIPGVSVWRGGYHEFLGVFGENSSDLLLV